jgi:hypothetical protein
MTEGEGFQGESWTIQCEILQGQLLGGLPQDEDPAPGPDAFPPGGLLTYLVLVKLVLVLPISQVILVVAFLVIILKWN